MPHQAKFVTNFQGRRCYGGGLVAKLCLTLCDPRDCHPPGSSVHWISQARVLAWVAISFSTDLLDPETELLQ